MTEQEQQAWAVVNGLSGIVPVSFLSCGSGNESHQIYADRNNDTFFCGECGYVPDLYVKPNDVPHLFD